MLRTCDPALNVYIRNARFATSPNRILIIIIIIVVISSTEFIDICYGNYKI
jgi:hypothetical protein